MLIRYSLLQSVGLLDERFPKHDGFVLTLRLAKRSEFVYVFEPLAEYRVYEGSDSGTFSNAQRRRYLENVYTEVLELSQGLPPQEIQQIKAAWSWRFVRLQMATEIEKGNRMKALWHLGSAIVHNPRQATRRFRRRVLR
jgi:GT2 family glycosyltransferase